MSRVAYSGHWIKMVSYLRSFFVLSFFTCLSIVPDVAMADLVMQFDSEAEQHRPKTLHPSETSMLESTDVTRVSVPWLLKYRSAHQVNDIVGASWVASNSTDCIEITPFKDPFIASFSLIKGSLFSSLNRVSGSPSICGEGLHQNLSFPLHIKSPLKNLHLDLNVNLSQDTLKPNTIIKASDLVWTLYSDANKQQRLGGINVTDSGFSKSGWGRVGSTYALYLVDEVTVLEPASELLPLDVESKPQRQKPKIVDGSITMIEVASVENVAPSRTTVDAPVITWAEGQSAQNLFLQVVRDLSVPSEGRFCLRPVYFYSNGMYGYYFPNGTPHGARIDSPSSIPTPGHQCGNPDQLLLELQIQTGGKTIDFGGKHRFSISQKDYNRTRFDLQKARIQMRGVGSKKSEQVATLNLEEDKGYWTMNSDNRVVGVMRTDGPQSTTSSVLKLFNWPELHQNDTPPAVLSINGKLSADFDSVDVNVGSQISLAWDKEGPQPVSARLCGNKDCTEKVEELALSTLGSISIQSGKYQRVVYLKLRWAVQKPAIADSSAEVVADDHLTKDESAVALRPDVVFQPVLKFGNHSKPLTSCLGQLVANEQSSEPFKLSGGGRQTLSGDSWLVDLDNEDTVQTRYSQNREGGKCVLDNIQLDARTVSSLITQAAKGPIVQEIAVDATLFVGFVNLSDKKTRDSIARWRETLNFMNQVYEIGRTENSWVDGVVFGATERSGEVKHRINPEGNFVRSLGDDQSFTELAKSMQYNKNMSNGWFADNLPSIASHVGEANVRLLYFDDVTDGCNDYRESLEFDSDPMKLIHTVVVAAATDNFDPNSAIRSLGDGLVHLCVSDPNLDVYIYNSAERLLNLDWGKALDAIFVDLENNGFKGNQE